MIASGTILIFPGRRFTKAAIRRDSSAFYGKSFILRMADVLPARRRLRIQW